MKQEAIHPQPAGSKYGYVNASLKGKPMKWSTFIFYAILLSSTITNAQMFTRILGDPVVSDNRYSEGSSWGDINNDGLLDVFIPDLFIENRNILFTNNGDGTFTEIVNGPVVTDFARSTGGNFGDIDNDGDLDLFVTNWFSSDNFLYENDGNGAFNRITTGAIVNDGGQSFGSSVIDYDSDGFLDVYVINGAFTNDGADNFLYHNNGDGTFTKITSGAPVNDGQHSNGNSWCDYDSDGDPDLFVANGGAFLVTQVDNVIYQNNGDGTFTEINPETIGIEHSYSSYGNWGDYDNDGDFDLFVTNYFGNNNILYKNNGNGTFSKVTTGVIVNDGGDSVSSTWGDFDNDGDLDLYVTNDFNENNNLYQNNGDGTFTKIISGDPSNDGGRSNGATWADYNNDGLLDLFVPNGQRPVTQSNILYLNTGSTGNNWINLSCVGTTSNRTAIGTEVRAKAVVNGVPLWQLRQISGCTGFNAQNSFNIEVGLGNAAQVDSLIIKWPSGVVDVYTNVDASLFYEAVEGTGLNPIITAIADQANTPTTFELQQNYPNPFNPTTRLNIAVATSGDVEVAVYNALGQQITSLQQGFLTPGRYTFEWKGESASGVPAVSGIYFIRMTASSYKKTIKAMLLR
ncbi:MAG: FG-GAP-like repeat-containing protein [Calditrichia bacterium]